ncbi:MAG: DUF4388 domain-containing protein [Actinomycetota bacterium]|nr:DUF4388 domain-containing protein [Actinomycetota bacterium]
MEGSLTGFTMEEIFEMLATKKKSGILTVESPDQGEGSIWLSRGQLSWAETSAVAVDVDGDMTPGWIKESIENALLEILNWPDGVYRFEAGPGEKKDSGVLLEVGVVLADVVKRQAEWDEIKTEIPSLKARVELITRVDSETINLTRDQWALISLIGKGVTVDNLQRQLKVSPLAICRALFSMSKNGLIRCLGEVAEIETGPQALKIDTANKSENKKYIRKSLLVDDEAENLVPAEWASYYQLLDSRKVLATSCRSGRAAEH